MKTTKFTVIIPTFNRTKELLLNLRIIENISTKIQMDIPIIIGDDGSRLEHREAIESFVKVSKNNIVYYYNEHNLGIEQNELKLVNMVKTEYALLLGEDDYLNVKLISRINHYVEEGKVSAIIPNFYGVNKYGKQIRTPMYTPRNDKIISKGSVKYFCYASQMSGLTFKVENVCSEYVKRNISGNSYPHLFFIAYNLENGDGVHITRYPFRNTVLKKKQFDYSVDNLLTDLLKIVNALNVSDNKKKKIVKFVLNNDVTRYSNSYTWTHPKKLFEKINNYDDTIDIWTRKEIKKHFILSYFRSPFIVMKYYYVRRKHYFNKVV